MKPKPITEKEFLRQVLDLAALCGWRVVHFRPARTARGWRTAGSGQVVGWPDVFAVHEGRGLVFAAELKVGNGQPSPQQTAWLRALGAAGIPGYLFRPRDWPTIERVLKGET